MKDLNNNYKIMLASASPRRQELLRMLGLDFELLLGKEVDESYPDTLPVEDVAAFLSRKKAEAYLPLLNSDQLLITADTVVINDGFVLGKPTDADEAIDMLHALADHTHRVITGVTIATTNCQTTFDATTEVTFGPLTDEEINNYVNEFNPLDKAGAYGIQEWIGCIAVRSINGSFYNVMGLPIHRLYMELKNF